MTPYEIMLSESQERMLLVAERGREREVLDVFKKWGLDAVVIGEVKDGELARGEKSRRGGGGNSSASAGGGRAGVSAADCGTGAASRVKRIGSCSRRTERT